MIVKHHKHFELLTLPNSSDFQLSIFRMCGKNQSNSFQFTGIKAIILVPNAAGIPCVPCLPGSEQEEAQTNTLLGGWS